MKLLGSKGKSPNRVLGDREADQRVSFHKTFNEKSPSNGYKKKLMLKLFMNIVSTELNPNRIRDQCFIDSQFAQVVGELKESCLGSKIEERFCFLAG